MPVLLVRAGAPTLPPAVTALLTDAFEPTDSFCSSVPLPPDAPSPGFVVAAGGATVSRHRTGRFGGSTRRRRHPGNRRGATGGARPALLTSLDLGPVYASDTSAARPRVRRSRRVPATRDGSPAGRRPVDLGDRQYRRDARRPLRPRRRRHRAQQRRRRPGLRVVRRGNPATAVSARGVGIAGRVGPETELRDRLDRRASAHRAIVDVRPRCSVGAHDSSDDTSNGGSTTQTYITARARSRARPRSGSATRSTRRRSPSRSSGAPTRRHRPVSTGSAPTVELRQPERHRRRDGDRRGAVRRRHLAYPRPDHRRRRLLANFAAGVGGFVADLDSRSDRPATTDDSITWRLDAVQTG